MSSPSRPLSPHLQVYRPQITSLLSITHRLTGIVLSIGTLLLVAQLVAAPTGPEEFAGVQGFLGSWLGLTLLIAWTAAFYFHFANGIRHLVWDAGLALDLPSAYLGGQIVLGATAVLTLVTWLAVLIAWRHV